jgi:hypothetical protein
MFVEGEDWKEDLLASWADYRADQSKFEYIRIKIGLSDYRGMGVYKRCVAGCPATAIRGLVYAWNDASSTMDATRLL